MAQTPRGQLADRRDDGARHRNECLEKHQPAGRRRRPAPRAAPGIIVVIPCHAETELLATLESLWACARPRTPVEVIVVINAGTDDSARTHSVNARTREEAERWIAAHQDAGLAFHLRHHPDLPPRHAGVGLARRLGMDEALGRLARAPGEGIIVSLDADCRCEPSYLVAIEAHFASHRETPGCSIHFEHPLEGDSDPALYDGIAHYELFLRYYRHALRCAGFPHAFYTVGSSMAVRGWAYRQQGGMNRRRAGEDFYFLNKVIALGGFSELATTTVIPSPRVSTRVPFGTGRAMLAWRDGTNRYERVYAPAIFADLHALIARVPDFYTALPTDPALLRGLPESVVGFLSALRFEARLAELQSNTASAAAFRKRFFRWFDGFRVVKFVHAAARDLHPGVPLNLAARTVAGWCGAPTHGFPDGADVRSLLAHFRALDRTERIPPPA